MEPIEIGTTVRTDDEEFIVAGPPGVAPGRCRSCGCTDNAACVDEPFGACYWVEDDLCSACVDREEASRAAP